jgi:hypothetical protein
MRAATLTLGIVQLPTDSVRKVYRVKRNKAKGKVCKSKRAGTRNSPGGGAGKSPAGGAGQKRHRDQSGGRASTPKKRRTAAATEADDMDEHNGHDALGRVKKLQSEAEAERKGVVEPIKAITGKVDELFREKIAKPCDAIRATVEAKLGLYAAAKLKRHREAEAKAKADLEAARAKAEAEAAEARRQQAIAESAAAKVRVELEAAELAARRAGDAEATAKAEAARAQAELAAVQAKAEADAAEVARQMTVIEAQGALLIAAADDGPVKVGAATGGYKSKWTATITDPAKVPDVYWRPDLELVQKAVDQGARAILGCEITEVLVVSNRRRG